MFEGKRAARRAVAPGASSSLCRLAGLVPATGFITLRLNSQLDSVIRGMRQILLRAEIPLCSLH